MLSTTARLSSRSVVCAARFTPRRFYSGGDGAGSVAKSQGFNKKEQAHENQYARQKEIEELKKLKEQLEKVQQEVKELKESKVEKE
ncbi:hypothetical protein M422DRAFT_262872 [Sphaerobolus stellatus SS14]|uniref:ATPase inhibitor, mitochondrial n=1 Tax=Sphaerobolus stellatus (strain SS14) TaxID=990650 RepID=A0A0C9V022_SPHS4|nr:hypothetical protein M422DRAFT_262872 [Sphaerobolus stellatus SS14]